MSSGNAGTVSRSEEGVVVNQVADFARKLRG
jgi:hypothetical protein